MKPVKPLGIKAYGSIPHLPGSRRGPADHGISESQASICTIKTRDKHDLVIVQEKLDGSNVAVAKINGSIIPLTRAGYHANDSLFTQHHFFSKWVDKNKIRFCDLLEEGERCVGEWLLQAHGTKYSLSHEPFVIFDIIKEGKRIMAWDLKNRCALFEFITPKIIHIGGAVSIESILAVLEPSGHGALEQVEGAVWRVERKGLVDFLCKFVRPEKIDGKYLESQTRVGPLYNIDPSQIL